MFKLRMIVPLVLASLLIAEGAAVLNAQVKTTEFDSDDVPLRIEREPLPAEEMSRANSTAPKRVRYRVYKKTNKSIRAHSITLDNGGERSVHTGIYWGASIHATSRLLFHELDNPKDPIWTIDWVLFDDGTIWGWDNSGQATGTLNFVKGMDTARAKAFELATPDETGLILRTLDNGGYFVHSLRFPLTVDRGYEQRLFKFGYLRTAQILLNHADRTQNTIARRIGARLKEIHDTGIPE